MPLLCCHQTCFALWSSFFSLLFFISLQCKTTSSIQLKISHHHHHHNHKTPIIQTNRSTCALFLGTWVLDETQTYPLYQSSSCSIIDPEFNCQMYGRPDSAYLKYRWKPINCELPRYKMYNTTQHNNKRLFCVLR